MIASPEFLSTLIQLWRQVSSRRKKQFVLLLLLMILSSMTEVISIAAIIPFLGVLTNPQPIYELDKIQPLLKLWGISQPTDLLLPLTLFFSGAACLAGATRLLLHWASAKLIFNTGADLSIDIYRKTLYQPYIVHISRNNSEVINGITGKAHLAVATVTHVLGILSSSIMIFAITTTLLIIQPVIALTAFLGLGILYAAVIGITHRRLLINSYKGAKNSTIVLKALQEGLGDIRNVLVDGTQEYYCEIYSKADVPLKQAQSANSFISVSPRFAMEALGMVLIATLAYGMANSADGLVGAIPVLGALTLGAQRLLPLAQSLYTSWSSIRGSQIALEDVLGLLEQPLPKYLVQNKTVKTLKFEKEIKLKNVSFTYPGNEKPILNNINITIKKGSRVGFVGVTGSGKSTLLDIIMGLLVPTQGTLEVDGRAIDGTDPRGWQARVAHVPQSIVLSDLTIAENIALGVPPAEIDLVRVIKASELAQIADTINLLPGGYGATVGERGVKISGGQRQRIGIARALYKKADVIIFDEATSALDNDTEKAVIDAIRSLSTDLTILTIAHRETTVKDCSTIYRMENGELLCQKAVDDDRPYR